MDAPDTLTDAQMHKLGGVDLPDTLTDDQIDRAGEKPQQYPPTEDEKLGIDTPLASPKGLVWDSRTKEFRKASEIGKEQALPPGFVPERGLIREDPAMAVATTIGGMGVGKVAGKLAAKASPILAEMVEPAAASAATSALQGGDRMENLKAAGLGAAMGVPGAALRLVRGAPAAVSERLPTAVTGGLKTKAAKKVVSGDIAADVLDAHPELKKVMATSANPEERAAAVSKVLGDLTAKTEPIYKQIGHVDLSALDKQLYTTASKLAAEGRGTEALAVGRARKHLAELYGTDGIIDEGTTLPARAARNLANDLGETAFANDTATPASKKALAQQRIYHTVTGEIENAAKAAGADVGQLRALNKQISALIPVKNVVAQQEMRESLAGPHSALSEIVKHPRHVIAGVIDEAPAKLDYALATSPKLQAGAKAASVPISALSRSAPVVAPRAAAGKRQQNDLEYAARVSALMNEGKSLQEAIDEAETR